MSLKNYNRLTSYDSSNDDDNSSDDDNDRVVYYDDDDVEVDDNDVFRDQ